MEQVKAYSETQCVHLLYMKWPDTGEKPPISILPNLKAWHDAHLPDTLLSTSILNNKLYMLMCTV